MKPEFHIIVKALVCGDRHWTNKAIIMKVLKEHGITQIIVGGASGADTIAEECAKKIKTIWGYPLVVWKYMADWKKYGRAAGPIRNKQMLEMGKPQIVFAFHDDIESSKGTKNMIMQANKEDIPVHLYSSNGEVRYCFTISK
jgi:hypothetical protein